KTTTLLHIMDAFKVSTFNLQQEKNQTRHKTEDLSSTTLVLRRGQAFTLTINYEGQPFDPLKDKMVFQIILGPLSVDVPVSTSRQPSLTQWTAVLKRSATGPTAPRALSVSLSSPASASIGIYMLEMRVESSLGVKTHSVGQITLLCNPWSQADSVYLESENLRTEYVRSDIGVLYKGSPYSVFPRPWSLDQYEEGILDICMKLLQLSPQHQADMGKDLQNRSDPVYIGRVISAMVNANDDKGVILGKWKGDYNDGVNPSTWTGSGDILKKWAETQFSGVKYGQCWVFAAVMCTVMRALGIPTRIITNFNSAHDTDGNMVIEEYYDEKGKKLEMGSDSIWNFHVWVESWMKRPDLGQGYDGWQVLDATPQERSGGYFRCGPASVKAIYQRKVEAQYDVPFIYAEVNADVHTKIVKNGKVLSTSVDKRRVGALICTKRPGSTRMQDVTSQYKNEWDFLEFRAPAAGDLDLESTSPGQDAADDTPSPAPSAAATKRHTSDFDEDDVVTKEASKGTAVSFKFLKPPVLGENISFNITIVNNEAAPKQLKKHVNAQNKVYNRNPTDTFWEAHDEVEIGPNETVTAEHEICFEEYMQKEAAEDFLVSLAVVIEDVNSQERVLAAEEFNICSPTLTVQVQNESSVNINAPQAATVSFVNPFNTAVCGHLTICGSGLLEEKAQMRVTIQPQETMREPVNFIPKMAGCKMLSASLVLTNPPAVLHGFTTINVQATQRSTLTDEDVVVAKKASKGVAVSLQLLKPLVLGENISFNIIIINNEATPKQLKKHVNAQNKVYNCNPTETFWEAHDDIKIGPNETVTAKHEICFEEYMQKEAAEDFLISLAVVIEDVKSQERVLAAEEFNICSPTLTVQIQNESSVIINAPQVATVSFVNPFNTAVSGELTVSGSGLLEEKAQMNVTIQPQETMRKPVNFTPKMAGSKMLSASLVLTNPHTVLHGFTTFNVQDLNMDVQQLQKKL
ncbi:protein-glutamine gamma-glutamyltransferase 5-like, partial [Garra rufa]|uniref:protein-glutamine gamma-glutamyltransferase 5-like n=1 Tax=Garra rufa TaxID=137080 RepID=UPI003CCE7338